MPVGVVVRRLPGVTRWAKWSWKAVALLPGAGPADWSELRREGDAVEYHAATLPLVLWRTDTEAYLHALGARVPTVAVVMRPTTDPQRPLDVFRVTASPYEAQDYQDSGEEIVELVPMTAGLRAWVQEFCDRHHEHEPFVKRRRGPRMEMREEDGKGDSRVRQISDVYRAPRPKERLQ